MRFSICNELFEGWDWERVCDFVAGAGYEGLEVAPFTLADSADQLSADRRRALRAAAERRGLTIVGLHWLLVKPAGLYITHPDASIRARTADYFVQLVDLCADLGGKVMVIGSPKQRSLLPGVSRDMALQFAREVFTPALSPAERRGVTLAFEPLAPVETDFINTAADAIALARQINHPNFSVNLDVKAMSSEPTPIAQVIANSVGQFAHVQVNDPNGRGPGMGAVRYEPIIAALRAAGYDGWLSVEAFDFSPGAEATALQSIEFLRSVCR